LCAFATNDRVRLVGYREAVSLVARNRPNASAVLAEARIHDIRESERFKRTHNLSRELEARHDQPFSSCAPQELHPLEFSLPTPREIVFLGRIRAVMPGTVFGVVCDPAASVSCAKRLSRSGSLAKCGAMTFIATSRRRRGSRARYTSPMPPAPSSATTSYGPIRLPDFKGTRRLYACRRRLEPRDHYSRFRMGPEADSGCD
jgi:hypothetical protein